MGRGWGAGATGPSAGLMCAFNPQEKLKRPTEVPRLQLSSGFVWDVGLDTLTPALPPHGESSDSEEDEKPEQATVTYLPGHHRFAGTLGSARLPCSALALVSLLAGGAVQGRECLLSQELPCRLLASTADLSGPEEQMTHLLLCFPQQKKKSKKERELEKQKAEKELSRIEEALMDPGRQPESAEDFDRLVLSSPSSSLLWLQYMAFHLQATEIEKARAVAERALKTISFRSWPRLPALGPIFLRGGLCLLRRPAAVAVAATRLSLRDGLAVT